MKEKPFGTKRWYEIVQILGIDLEPMIWFIMTAAFIFIGSKLIYSGLETAAVNGAITAKAAGETAAGTLFASLGGAGIGRIRSSRERLARQPPISS